MCKITNGNIKRSTHKKSWKKDMSELVPTCHLTTPNNLTHICLVREICFYRKESLRMRVSKRAGNRYREGEKKSKGWLKME